MATNKRITIGSAAFGALDEGKILANPNPQEVTSISPVLLDLPWDVFEFSVKSDMLGKRYFLDIDKEYLQADTDGRIYISEGDLLATEYGEDIELYAGEELRGKYYLKGITAEKNGSFSIKAVSGIGILEDQIFMGNYYTNETVADIIADIIGDAITYTVADRVGNLILSGPIKPMTKRRALSAVLLVTGASILRDENGDMFIDYNQQGDAHQIGPQGIGGKRLDYNRASKVIVTEHMHFESSSATEEVLFDNTDDVNVVNHTIIFDEPMHSFRVEGITLVASGPFYATLTGVGVLYAVPYVHVQRDISGTTGAAGTTNELRVDCSFVGPASSQAVLDRVKNFEKNAKLAEIEALVTSEKAGDMVLYEDPYDGESTGIITNMNRTISGQDKAQLTIAKDWKPGPFGNAFDSFVIVTAADIDENGDYWLPAEAVHKQGRIVLFSGAEGGQGGWYGETKGEVAGGNTDTLIRELDSGDEYTLGTPGQIQSGGAGGQGGKGGTGATKMFTINASMLPTRLKDCSFGAGGTGGAGGTAVRGADMQLVETPPEDGEPGGATDVTIVSTAYSTDNGTVFRGTYYNLVTGDVVIEDGGTGTAGASGGAGGTAVQSQGFNTTAEADAWNFATIGKGSNGQSLSGYTGGAGGAGTKGSIINNSSGVYNLPKKAAVLIANASGGGGGGAALGGNGSAGEAGNPQRVTIRHLNGHVFDHYEYFYYANETREERDEESEHYGDVTVFGGKGGDGGNASVIPAQPTSTTVFRGGTGGAGGGGGGGAAQCLGNRYGSGASTDYMRGHSIGGKGGNGGQGGQGSDGFAIIYWKS